MIRKFLLPSTLLVLLPVTLLAQTWEAGGDTLSWGNPDNWSSPPANPTANTISFNLDGSVPIPDTDITSILDQDRTVGAISFNDSAADGRAHRIDLNSLTLTMDGGIFVVGNFQSSNPQPGHLTLQNGTLNGSLDRLDVGIGGTSSSHDDVFGFLDLTNVSVNFTTNQTRVGFNRNNEGTLLFGNNTVLNTGSLETTSNLNSNATISFGNNSTIQIGSESTPGSVSLNNGRSGNTNLTIGSGSNLSFYVNTFDFGSSTVTSNLPIVTNDQNFTHLTGTVMEVYQSLAIGAMRQSDLSVRLGANSSVLWGQSDSGRANATIGSSNSNLTQGLFSVGSGSTFDGFLDNLIIGGSSGTTASSLAQSNQGTLDLSMAESVSIDALNILVGTKLNDTSPTYAQGTFLAANGSGNANQLQIGDSFTGHAGYVSLTNFVLTVEDSVFLETGTLSGLTESSLLSHLDGHSSGLILSNSTTMTIGNGSWDIIFEEPENLDGSLYYALVWHGIDRTNILLDWLSEGKLTLDTSGLSTHAPLFPEDLIFYDDINEQTVIGLIVIPEPALITGFLAISLLGFSTLLRASRRRTAR